MEEVSKVISGSPMKVNQVYNNNNYSFNEHHFPKRPALDLSFTDIRYSVTSWANRTREKKEILRGVSGEFKSGELTAIMGPSGAGKSTLLNILAGFTLRGSSGLVMLNGHDRKEVGMENFSRVSCYIQQDDEVRPLLTVKEALTMAAHLKLGFSVTYKEKKQQIAELLAMLGLSNHSHTMTKKLSGGQRKRLSIALELITNPPLIFLDEPTTGLDSSSTTSCISLLKDLAHQGRTVVCTIHQPSSLLFEMMDHLYTVALGRCIYQGSIKELVPHLATLGLNCPPYHNPADFLIEVAVGEYTADMNVLAAAASQSTRSILQKRTSTTVVEQENGIPLQLLQSSHQSAADIIEFSACQPKPAPLWAQAYYLYNRNLLIIRRSYSNLGWRLLIHILISLVYGCLYRNVGNSASSVFANYVYVYGTCLFLHYTGQMAVTLSFPLEYKILTREHFNNWYSLAPYWLSVLLVEVPFQLFCVVTYLVPSYYLTGQPNDLMRLCYFLLFTIVVSLTAQGFGFLIGATLPVTIAVFLGPVTTCFLSVFGFSNRYSDMSPFFQVFYKISYYRVAFQGSLSVLYGMNRTLLPCSNNFYCHYRNPTKLLREMEVTDLDLAFDYSFVISFGIVFYLILFAVVWFRLNKR